MLKRIGCLLITLVLCLTLVPRAYAQEDMPAGTAEQTGIADSGTVGNISWTLDSSGRLTVSGAGDMPYCALEAEVPWYSYTEQIQSVVIEKGITSVGPYAFMNCLNLKEVTIPEGVTTICKDAFHFCKKLTAVTIPDSVESIEIRAFTLCERLVSLDLGQGVQVISNYAFDMCRALTSLTIPASVTDLYNYAFASCEKLETVTFEGDMPAFHGDVFSGVGLLSNVICYYPANNATWINMGSYGGRLTWTQKNSTETPVDPPVDPPADPEPSRDVIRLSGAGRVETSLAIADQVKKTLETDQFNAVVVANAKNFPDALTGSYLAIGKKAPILLTMSGSHEKVADYIKANLAENGKVYILGGTGAVSVDFADLLAGYDVERLSGKSRYDTNLVILEEAGITNQEILISTGLNFADSLSASAANLPVLMVNGKGTLTDSQKAFLETYKGNKMTIIGGSGAVSEAIKAEIEAIVGHEISRLSGKSRQETSVLVAETYIKNPASIVLASSMNFPDGLCGGPLAYYLGAPLILTALNQEAAADEYVSDRNITAGFVLGGTGAVKDETVAAVFAQ